MSGAINIDQFMTFLLIILYTIVPNQVDKYARIINKSKLLRGTLFKPRRRQLALVRQYTIHHIA